MNDVVNNPKHYTSHPSGIECIEVTEHMNFCIGNAIKYLWRAGLKDDDVQDMEKAVWYIQREIKRRLKTGGAKTNGKFAGIRADRLDNLPRTGDASSSVHKWNGTLAPDAAKHVVQPACVKAQRVEQRPCVSSDCSGRFEDEQAFGVSSPAGHSISEYVRNNF